MTWQNFAKDLIMDPSLEWALALVTEHAALVPSLLILGVILLVFGATYFFYTNGKTQNIPIRRNTLIFFSWFLAFIALILGILMWFGFIISLDTIVLDLYGEFINNVYQLSYYQNTQILEYLRNLIILEFLLLLPIITWFSLLVIEKFEITEFSIFCLYCDPIDVARVVADEDIYYSFDGEKYTELLVGKSISQIRSRIIYIYCKDKEDKGIYLTNTRKDAINNQKLGILHYNRLSKKLRLILHGGEIAQIQNEGIFVLVRTGISSPFMMEDRDGNNNQNLGIKLQFLATDGSMKRRAILGTGLAVLILALVSSFHGSSGVMASPLNTFSTNSLQVCPEKVEINYLGPISDIQDTNSSNPWHVRGVIHFPGDRNGSSRGEPKLSLRLPGEDPRPIPDDHVYWSTLTSLDVKFLFDLDHKVIYEPGIENPLRPGTQDGITKESEFWYMLEDTLIAAFRFDGIRPYSDIGHAYSMGLCADLQPLTDLYLDVTGKEEYGGGVYRLTTENGVRNALRLGQNCAYQEPLEDPVDDYTEVHDKLLPKAERKGNDPYPVLVILRWKGGGDLAKETGVDQDRGTVIIVNLGRELTFESRPENHHRVFDLKSPVISEKNTISEFSEEFLRFIKIIRNSEGSIYFDAELPYRFDRYASEKSFFEIEDNSCGDNGADNLLTDRKVMNENESTDSDQKYLIMIIVPIIIALDLLIFLVALYVFIY